jgi:hypothetical protein
VIRLAVGAVCDRRSFVESVTFRNKKRAVTDRTYSCSDALHATFGASFAGVQSSFGHNRGLTTIELAVVLSITVILASSFGLMVYDSVQTDRRDAVLIQLDLIKKGIVGEGRTLAPGETDVLRFGYIGDMGTLPATLSNLVDIGTQPAYTVDEILQAGAGWRGPYVPTAAAAVTTDPWGNGLVWTVAAGTSATTGAGTMATLRSKGPDGVASNSDDAVVEIYRSDVLTRTIGYVKDVSGVTVAGVVVKASYATSGTLTTVSTTTDNDGLYEFYDVPRGTRAIQLESKLTFQKDTAYTTGAAWNNVQFTIENLNRSATNVTSFTLTYTSSPQAYYREVIINGTQVRNSTSPRAGTGTTVTFSSTAAGGTGVIQEPLRVQLQGEVMQVPDVLVGAIGTGGTLEIELNDFADVSTGNGTNVEMTGVTFSIVFSDGSQTLFTPRRFP